MGADSSGFHAIDAAGTGGVTRPRVRRLPRDARRSPESKARTLVMELPMRRTTLCLVSALALGAAPPAAEAGERRDARRIPAGTVHAAFERGAPLLETGAYKIHASRRDAPGEGEVHELDTDVLYVLEGTATLVTGGVLVGPRAVAPHELRAAAIEGGTPQRLAAGDVVVVPHGVPHRFEAVEPPFLYYVVKVTAPEAAR
jgi:mannose-6-phosphate isomerase-like protein (cupin superfamily)